MAAPRAICTASSTSQKEEQVKDPRKLWGLSSTCPREQENSSLSKAKCFNITTLIPKSYIAVVLCPLDRDQRLS
jgi:hypothetical protein